MKSTATGKPRVARTAFGDLRKMLLRRRAELFAQMHGELARSRPDTVGARFDDEADRASTAFYDELAQGFAEIASADLRSIDRAIHRMDRGVYGQCEACGRAIPRLRLRALPFAELCVECKRDEESAEAHRVHRAAAPPIDDN